MDIIFVSDRGLFSLEDGVRVASNGVEDKWFAVRARALKERKLVGSD